MITIRIKTPPQLTCFKSYNIRHGRNVNYNSIQILMNLKL
jgi:hypothetical protein